MGSGRNVTNDGELLDVQPGRPLVVFTRKALDYERKEADRVFKVLCKKSTCDSELIGKSYHHGTMKNDFTRCTSSSQLCRWICSSKQLLLLQSHWWQVLPGNCTFLFLSRIKNWTFFLVVWVFRRLSCSWCFLGYWPWPWWKRCSFDSYWRRSNNLLIFEYLHDHILQPF